jgi:tRNA(adenine34) deaminase
VHNETGGLAAPVWACLDQAWQSLLHGNLPIGAVLLDGSGGIVSTGQNMVYVPDPGQTRPRVERSLLAHAEINALVGLDPELRYRDHHLVSSLEPCPLCVGAVRQSTLGQLTYLGADPFNGAATVPVTTPYVSRVPLQVTGPDETAAGRLAAGLHVAFFLRRRPGGPCVTAHRQHRPDLVAAAEALVSAGVFGLAERQLPWAAVAARLLAAV